MTQPANSDKPDDALHLAAEAGNLEFSIFEDNGAVVSQNDENNDFTWGYYGWGNHTPQLIEAVDAVERNRGFEPPLFVDIRIRRTVGQRASRATHSRS